MSHQSHSNVPTPPLSDEISAYQITHLLVYSQDQSIETLMSVFGVSSRTALALRNNNTMRTAIPGYRDTIRVLQQNFELLESSRLRSRQITENLFQSARQLVRVSHIIRMVLSPDRMQFRDLPPVPIELIHNVSDRPDILISWAARGVVMQIEYICALITPPADVNMAYLPRDLDPHGMSMDDLLSGVFSDPPNSVPSDRR
jgi:hypothetical protein